MIRKNSHLYHISHIAASAATLNAYTLPRGWKAEEF